MVQPLMKVKVAKKTLEATDICSFELTDPAGGELPAFTAGSHVDVHIGEGLIRQYSLWQTRRFGLLSDRGQERAAVARRIALDA